MKEAASNLDLLKIGIQGFHILITIGLGVIVIFTNRSLEKLKSSYQKENIAYQIYLAELTKYRFENFTTILKHIFSVKTIIYKVVFDEEYDSSLRKELNKKQTELEKIFIDLKLIITEEINKDIKSLISLSNYILIESMLRERAKKQYDIFEAKNDENRQIHASKRIKEFDEALCAKYDESRKLINSIEKKLKKELNGNNQS